MDLLGKKKEENIGGYIISMWHIEDLMRANDFDMRKVEERLIEPMDADEDARTEVREWYAGIIARMKEQGIQRVGHLTEVEETMNELEFLHRSLVDVLNDEEYDALYTQALPGIQALQQHAGGDPAGAIETCFTAIYGVMLLRAQQREVTESTAQAETHIRRLLDRLSQHYRHMRKLPGVSMN